LFWAEQAGTGAALTDAAVAHGGRELLVADPKASMLEVLGCEPPLPAAG
jgi:hypothetical protein